MNKYCSLHPLCRVIAICNNSRNEILFQRNKESENMSTMNLPGDFVRYGEIPEEAIRRSIFDQTTLCVEPIDILGIYSKIDSQSGIHVIESVFVCIITNSPKMGSKIDPPQCVWLDRGKIETMEGNICDIKIVKDYYQWRIQKSTFWSTKI
ncbi:MAG TPA: NUDIX domain-containing protein [Candidatus Nitrosocosmicus sp.]|nr:NUDIX domain-containing protein [Candidatus Nitrosocosmicus sp.]